MRRAAHAGFLDPKPLKGPKLLADDQLHFYHMII